MAQERVLITGGAGFIGSHLAERLLNDGCAVTVFDLLDDYYDPALKRANLARLSDRAGYSFVVGDITVPADLQQLGSTPFDHIVHLAARVGVRASLTDPAAYIRHNILGTQALLEFARSRMRGHFLFASSSSVYGDRQNGPFRESDSTDAPETVYAGSKKAGELLCHTYHKLYGLSTICLRLFTVYGPRQRPEMGIAKFAQLIRTGQPLPVLGDLQSARDYTFVTDTVDGFVRAMRSSVAHGIYNLGCGQPVTLENMVQTLAQALGRKPIVAPQPKADGDVFLTFANIDKAQRDFGYRPQVAFAAGVQQYVASLEATR